MFFEVSPGAISNSNSRRIHPVESGAPNFRTIWTPSAEILQTLSTRSKEHPKPASTEPTGAVETSQSPAKLYPRCLSLTLDFRLQVATASAVFAVLDVTPPSLRAQLPLAQGTARELMSSTHGSCQETLARAIREVRHVGRWRHEFFGAIAACVCLLLWKRGVPT